MMRFSSPIKLAALEEDRRMFSSVSCAGLSIPRALARTTETGRLDIDGGLLVFMMMSPGKFQERMEIKFG